MLSIVTDTFLHSLPFRTGNRYPKSQVRTRASQVFYLILGCEKGNDPLMKSNTLARVVKSRISGNMDRVRYALVTFES